MNLGCARFRLDGDPEWPRDWREVRVDLDPRAEPDVVADVEDLPFPDGHADGIVCDSVLEHLEEHRLAPILTEFRRVLRPGGFLILRVPDLEAVAELIVEGRLVDVLYESGAGPVRALDVLYGLASAVETHPLMAHRTGFTSATLQSWLAAAGFSGSVARVEGYALRAEAKRE